MNLLEFYGLFYDAVKNWSQKDSEGQPQCRLNTFAVIKSSHSVNADNLNKDNRYKNKRLFFSRRWADTGHNPSKVTFDYPAAFLVHDTENIKNPFGEYQNDRIKFNLFVLDKLPSDPKKTGNAATLEEVINKTKILHRQLRVLVGKHEMSDGMHLSQLTTGQAEAAVICDYGEDGTVGYFMNFTIEFDACIELPNMAEFSEFDEHDKGCC